MISSAIKQRLIARLPIKTSGLLQIRTIGAYVQVDIADTSLQVAGLQLYATTPVSRAIAL